MAKSINKKVSAKEKIESVISRINGQRKELEQYLKAIDLKIEQGNKKDNTENLGFDINNIQKNIEEIKSLVVKRDAIARVLEKDNYCDSEFCNAAKEYIEEIREDIKQNDRRIQENLEEIEQAEMHLEELIEKVERENCEILRETGDLLKVLGRSTTTRTGYELSGTYILEKIERNLSKILNK